MNEINEFQIGDKVVYKGNTSITWIIEHIGDNHVSCSAMKPDTFELVKCEFSLTSISKYVRPKINIVSSNNRNRF